MSARLSDIEREVLTEALAAPDEGCWDNEPCCWSSAESMFKAVESILAARFAEAEQAAEQREHVVHVTDKPVAEDVVWCEDCEEWVTSGGPESLDRAILAARLAEAEQAAERVLTAVTQFADARGVNVGDDDSEWWQGYRQAQRECWYDAQALRALVAQQRDGGGSDG